MRTVNSSPWVRPFSAELRWWLSNVGKPFESVEVEDRRRRGWKL
jgi:hypothetical protein